MAGLSGSPGHLFGPQSLARQPQEYLMAKIRKMLQVVGESHRQRRDSTLGQAPHRRNDIVGTADDGQRPISAGRPNAVCPERFQR